MAATSKHWADVKEWVYTVIDSCVTIRQVLSAKRLVRLYVKKYPHKKWGDTQHILNECMIDYCDRRYREIIK